MPKKTDPPMNQAEQSRRFEEAARAIEADGGLSPTEAAELMNKTLSRLSSPNREGGTIRNFVCGGHNG
jgi:hypothetical protein